MYKRGIFTIVSNELIARDVYRMVLAGDTSDLQVPGRFVNIELDGFYLRRPISVNDVNEKEPAGLLLKLFIKLNKRILTLLLWMLYFLVVMVSQF